MDKLDLVYKFSNTLCINTGPLGWDVTPPPTTTALSTTIALIPAIKIIMVALKVDQLVSDKSTLTLEDTPLSRARSKRSRDEDMHSPLEKGFS